MTIRPNRVCLQWWWTHRTLFCLKWPFSPSVWSNDKPRLMKSLRISRLIKISKDRGSIVAFRSRMRQLLRSERLGVCIDNSNLPRRRPLVTIKFTWLTLMPVKSLSCQTRSWIWSPSRPSFKLPVYPNAPPKWWRKGWKPLYTLNSKRLSWNSTISESSGPCLKWRVTTSKWREKNASVRGSRSAPWSLPTNSARRLRKSCGKTSSPPLPASWLKSLTNFDPKWIFRKLMNN